MENSNPMICPDCGVEMNLHAEKINYTRAADEVSGNDRAFDGVLEEFHSCPQCGATAARAEPQAA